MKNKEIKNLPASVRARLYNIARQTGREFDAIVLQYFQERFLYRISRSDFRENFILKGALLLLSRNITRFRPTKDIDLLGGTKKGQSKFFALPPRAVKPLARRAQLPFIIYNL